MKNILVLHHKDGLIKTVRWGDIPGEWHVPQYFEIKEDGFIEENEPSISSTIGKKTFYLVARIKSGHLWWKKNYGHYTEKLENRNIGQLLDVWKKDKKTKPLSKILFS